MNMQGAEWSQCCNLSQSWGALGARAPPARPRPLSKEANVFRAPAGATPRIAIDCNIAIGQRKASEDVLHAGAQWASQPRAQRTGTLAVKEKPMQSTAWGYVAEAGDGARNGETERDLSIIGLMGNGLAPGLAKSAGVMKVSHRHEFQYIVPWTCIHPKVVAGNRSSRR